MVELWKTRKNGLQIKIITNQWHVDMCKRKSNKKDMLNKWICKGILVILTKSHGLDPEEKKLRGWTCNTK